MEEEYEACPKCGDVMDVVSLPSHVEVCNAFLPPSTASALSDIEQERGVSMDTSFITDLVDGGLRNVSLDFVSVGAAMEKLAKDIRRLPAVHSIRPQLNHLLDEIMALETRERKIYAVINERLGQGEGSTNVGAVECTGATSLVPLPLSHCFEDDLKLAFSDTYSASPNSVRIILARNICCFSEFCDVYCSVDLFEPLVELRAQDLYEGIGAAVRADPGAKITQHAEELFNRCVFAADLRRIGLKGSMEVLSRMSTHADCKSWTSIAIEAIMQKNEVPERSVYLLQIERLISDDTVLCRRDDEHRFFAAVSHGLAKTLKEERDSSRALAMVNSVEASILTLRDSVDGDGPLHWASRLGCVHVGQVLLEQKLVNIEDKNNLGMSALHRACTQGQFQLVQLLLAHRADPAVQGFLDMTPLHLAVLRGDVAVAIVKELLNCKRTPVNARDKYGWTPTMWAAQLKSMALVKLLLVDGHANPHLVAWDNVTCALTLAREEYLYARNHDDLVGFLEPFLETHPLLQAVPIERPEVVEKVKGLQQQVPTVGQGAFGSVYKYGFYAGVRSVAKIVHKNSKEAAAQFATEVELMYRAKDGPNIVQILGFTQSPKAIIMEEMEGSLLDFIPSVKDLSAMPSERLILDLALDVACGMEYLHSLNILHRDLKPHNVLLKSDLSAKVCDFGVSRVSPETLEESHAAGTRAYMAPETFFDCVSSKASDVFSFGSTLFHLRSGQVPFVDHSRARGKRPDIQRYPYPKCRAVLLRSWEEEYSRRPTFADIVEEVKSELAKCWDAQDESACTKCGLKKGTKEYTHCMECERDLQLQLLKGRIGKRFLVAKE